MGLLGAVDLFQGIESTKEGAFECGKLGRDAAEQFGFGRIGEEDEAVEIVGGGAVFGTDGAVEVSLQAAETAAQPIGVDDGGEVVLFERRAGIELFCL